MQDINIKLNDIRQKLENGDIDTAVRDSAELFAQANEIWTADYNAGRPADRSLADLAVSSIAHIQALAGAGLVRDAYETATSMTYLLCREKPASRETQYALIPLFVLSISMFMRVLPQIGTQPDETQREHATVVTGLTASMLYYYYNLCKDVHPDVDPTKAAHSILQDMIHSGLVQSPTLHTPDGDVQPTDYEAVFAEIIGRAKALGLFAGQQ